jgi:hypothetical protein
MDVLAANRSYTVAALAFKTRLMLYSMLSVGWYFHLEQPWGFF